jgi:tripartite-type tricarboxylate transporter receptor subunit TctC
MNKIIYTLVAVAAMTFSGLAHAWPNRAITLVMPFSPGGGTDIQARNIQAQLSQALGQSVLIDYKPGGAGLIAIRHVLNSDDHTLLMTTTDTVVTAASVPNQNFNIQDLKPITAMTRSTLVLATLPNSPYTDFRNVVTDLKNNKAVSFGSPSTGTISHLVLEKLLPPLTDQPIIVQYKGGAPMAADTMAGHHSLSISSYGGTHQPFIASGKLVAAVAFSEKRLEHLPQVPTARELGFDIVASVSTTVFGNKKLSSEHAEILSRAFQQAVNYPENRDNFVARGQEIMATSPSDTQKFVNQEITTWAPYVRQVVSK